MTFDNFTPKKNNEIAEINLYYLLIIKFKSYGQ
jgi:hypothetical protein